MLDKLGRMGMLEDIETLYVALPYTAVILFKRVKMPFHIVKITTQISVSFPIPTSSTR